MKKIKTILMLTLLWTVVPTAFVACSGGDDAEPDNTQIDDKEDPDNSQGDDNEDPDNPQGDEEEQVNIHVTINDDGTTSDGSLFSAIDEKNFYLGYIKYTVEDGYLMVSGYDKTGFSGTANIVSGVTYKGNSYDVLAIRSQAFYNCSQLTKVSIPNNVTSIGSWAFDGCNGLTAVAIPESVASIGKGAFNGCSSLTSATVDEENPVYDSRDNCNAIIETASNTLIAGFRSTVIPESVTGIGNAAFRGCSSATSVTIPKGVTSIADQAFYDCTGIASVTIPESMTSIGYSAFYGCSSLTSVYSLIKEPFSIPNDVFYGMAKNATLYVPQGTKHAYESTNYWTNLFSRVAEFDTTGR